MKKIVITGGHLTPALAVIDELRAQGGWEILFIGRTHASELDQATSVESQIIPKMGINFVPIITGRIYREISLTAIFSFLKIPLGFGQSLFNLLKFRPDVILSFGGYLSVPIVFAGWLLGIPIVCHEQTTVKGLATRFNLLFARIIAVSWPEILNAFPKGKAVLTGNPIRKELGFTEKLPLIFVTGGNQGSHIINRTVADILSRILLKANVFHQCGHLTTYGDLKKLELVKNQLPTSLKPRYQVHSYISGESMGTLLNQADLVISRGGINTITELMALGKPAILIPHPRIYQDEQLRNAQMMAKTGLARIILQRDLSPEKLYGQILEMLNDLPKYEQPARKAQKLVKLNAAKKITGILREVVAKF
jgi:UDP-N-acetylglucosamine--N-acetylmuramyl-(pentapeptide) pyrophosphoryl-undecaprenol N-acetylglucosamine transferase